MNYFFYLKKMVGEKVGVLCVLCVPLMGLNVEEEKRGKKVSK
jgi:hypothetical protein